jgi:hypothetical protein
MDMFGNKRNKNADLFLMFLFLEKGTKGTKGTLFQMFLFEKKRNKRNTLSIDSVPIVPFEEERVPAAVTECYRGIELKWWPVPDRKGKYDLSKMREPINQGKNLLQMRNVHISGELHADSKAGVCTGGQQDANRYLREL